MYKYHDIISFSPKSRRAEYREGQKGRDDGKDKRGEENGRGERGRKSHCRNKVNLVVEESNGSKVSVYHHIIYWYYQKLIVLG